MTGEMCVVGQMFNLGSRNSSLIGAFFFRSLGEDELIDVPENPNPVQTTAGT